MSEPSPASDGQSLASVRLRPRLAAGLLLLAAGLCGGPAEAAAQAHRVLLIRGERPENGSALWSALPPESAGASRDLRAVVAPPGQLPATPRGRIGELEALEALLAEAQRAAASLDEVKALSLLARADVDAQRLADVPGAAAYNAEVHLRIGVTAAQAGLTALADDAFRRVASLDPGRVLGAAEAPPVVVERARRIARSVVTGPKGALRVTSRAAGARVFVDDVDRGPVPVALRLPVGHHLLRVSAPGYLSYGASLDVFAGERPTIAVALSPDPAVLAADAMSEAVAAGDFAAVRRALSALEAAGAPLSAHVLEVGEGGKRAILVRCDLASCRAPVHIEAGARPAPPSLGGLLTDSALGRARAWLAAPTSPVRVSQDEPSHWGLWALSVAGAAATAALVVGISGSDGSSKRLRVVVDPADVGQ